MPKHLSRMLWGFLLAGLLCAAGAARAAAGAPLVVQGLGDATAPLNGTWQFHLGDNMAWVAPGLDDSSWEAIQADRPWGMQGHEGYTGFAWYRRHIDFVTVPGAKPDLALLIPPVQDAYEVYWNGVPVGSFGKVPPHPIWYFAPSSHTFGLGTERQGVLAVRVWKAPYNSFDSGQIGGLTGLPLAGSPNAIAALKGAMDYAWLRNREYGLVLDFLYALVALFGLLAWMRDRSQRALLWVSLFALSHVLTTVLTGFRLPWPETLAVGVLQPVLSLQDIALWFLLLYLLKLDGNPLLMRWTRWLAVISVVSTTVDGSLAAFDWAGPHGHAFQVADAVCTVIFTVIEVYPLVLVPFAFDKKLDASRWMVAGFAMLTEMVLVFRIAMQQGQRYTHWTIGEKVFTPLFIVRGNQFNLVTITTTLLFVAIIYAVYRYTVEQSERQSAIEQEYRSAQELQRVLVPETLPSLPGYAVTSAYIPAQEVGGDFFQVIPQLDGSALLVLGDVSGKGLKAAMTVSLIIGTLRTLAEMFEEPAEILAGLNRRLVGRLQNGFATCVVLRLHPQGSFTVATAGHPAPFWNDAEIVLPGSLPLGLAPGVSFEQTAFQLEVGDRLTLYTDGLLEARSPSGELYSFERLSALLATRPDAHKAGEAAVAFGQDDDITVLTVTRLALGAESTTSLVAPVLVTAPA